MTELGGRGAVRTIFLGSGSFAVPIVDVLSEHPSVDLLAVVTAPTRAGSRGRPTDPPVAVWAMEHGLPMLRPARLRTADSIADLEALAPDLLVLADYGQIVPQRLLGLPRHGALNVHPSLLPRYRGASPIPAAILNGDVQTGVTLMLMDAGMDTGPLVATRPVHIGPTMTASELEQRLARAGADLVRDKLPAWLAGALPLHPQEGEVVTTKLLRREDGRLDPRNRTSHLDRQIRAYHPWPGAFVEADGVRISIWEAHPLSTDEPHQPGTLIRVAGSNDLALVAADGALALDVVQPAGGRRMSGAELLRGRPELAGANVLPGPEATRGASA